VTGQHRDPEPRPRRRWGEWLASLRWLGWVAATALYGWLAHGVAKLGMPVLVTVLVVLTSGCAFTAGHVRGRRETD